MRLPSKALIAILVAAATAVPAIAQNATTTVASAPESTSTAALECGDEFTAWKQNLANEGRAAGVGEKGLSALANASLDPKVLERDRAQGVFAQTFTQFSERMISDYRLKHGAANLQKYAPYFARSEQDYGVPGPVIAAFWALETDFGAVQGNFNSLNALVTLAHDCRRPELFRKQIVPLMKLIDTDVLPADVKGAWAGEIGQTQILPSDYLARGVDGDGDGVIDLRNSAADVILTTGKKIQSRGWKPNQPWIEEIRVPAEMDWALTGRTNKLPLTDWAKMGVTNRDGSPLVDNGLKAGVVLPMGRKGPAFLTYDNYDVYLEWNQSATYTLTAANLAARLAGQPAFDRGNPDAGLTGDAMKALQQKLADKGYDVGGIDGILGTNTREAIRQEQMRLKLPVDGWPTQELLADL